MVGRGRCHNPGLCCNPGAVPQLRDSATTRERCLDPMDECLLAACMAKPPLGHKHHLHRGCEGRGEGSAWGN